MVEAVGWREEVDDAVPPLALPLIVPVSEGELVPLFVVTLQALGGGVGVDTVDGEFDLEGKGVEDTVGVLDGEIEGEGEEEEEGVEREEVEGETLVLTLGVEDSVPEEV